MPSNTLAIFMRNPWQNAGHCYSAFSHGLLDFCTPSQTAFERP
jgi:hypothetical protein